jgi:protein-L-isoaspartate(D-aspartate) O-methyltransferase
VNEQDFSTMRAAMVASQLRTNGITDVQLLDAFGSVPRERFVPTDRKALAYVDIPVPLGNGRAINPPLVTARLIQEANVRPGAHVALVGSATGYAAAILAAMGCRVTAIESDASLVSAARANLQGVDGIDLIEGPLAQGAATAAPFDAIIIDGAFEVLPDTLWTQLDEGAALTGAEQDGAVIHLVRGVRSGAGRRMMPVIEMDAVPLPGFARAREFAF